MLVSLAISFLCGVAVIYLLFCLFLNAPIAGGGVKPYLAKHGWFITISMYIGKAIFWAIIIAFVTAVPYILLYWRR